MGTATKKQSEVPELRFPEFKEDWRVSTLGKESTFHDEKRIPLKQADREKRDGPYRYYGASGVIDYIDDYLFDGDYVLLGEDGANITDRSSRLAFVVSGKFWVNNHAHVIEAKASQYFLAEYLESLKYDKYNSGTAQPKLNSAVCKKIKIVIPSAEEQQKIADFLESVDGWLDNLRQQKTALETYKRGMMQKLFTQQVRFKDEHGKNFPNWQKKTLGEVSKITMGQSPESYSYNIDGNGKYLIQGNADIKERKTCPRVWTSTPTKLCSVGDVIMTVRAPVGFIAKSLHDACIGRGVCSIKANSTNITEYLYHFLLSYEDKWAKYSQGSTFTAVNSNDVKSLSLNIPTQNEQQKIADFLTAIDETITAKAAEITKVEQWKKGLMQKMFV